MVHINTPFRPEDNGAPKIGGPRGPWLLGLDCGHLPIYEKLKEKHENEVKDAPGNTVSFSNSGQMIVVPAWKIHEMLYQGILMENRAREEERLKSFL